MHGEAIFSKLIVATDWLIDWLISLSFRLCIPLSVFRGSSRVGEWSPTRVYLLHAALFSAILAVNLSCLISFFKASNHLFFCLPLLPSPYTSVFTIHLVLLFSPLRSTWPCHSNLVSRTLSSLIPATPTLRRISTFHLLCFNEIPSIHLSIHIAILSNSISSFLLKVQTPAP